MSNTPEPNWLHPTPVEPLRGDERFAGVDATVADFWSWGFSDLRSNVVRGVLAEFLVAKAVKAEQTVRETWDNYDVLAPDGTRIEVKSSAYLQSWTQKERSQLSFGRLTGREWDANANAWGTERRVRADVFVFAVHTEWAPDRYDNLDLSKWEFYVVGADAVREAGSRTAGIGWVRQYASRAVDLAGLADEIRRVSDDGSSSSPTTQ